MKRVSITAVNADGDQVVGTKGCEGGRQTAAPALSAIHTHTHGVREDINVCMNACMKKKAFADANS